VAFNPLYSWRREWHSRPATIQVICCLSISQKTDYISYMHLFFNLNVVHRENLFALLTFRRCTTQYVVVQLRFTDAWFVQSLNRIFAGKRSYKTFGGRETVPSKCPAMQLRQILRRNVSAVLANRPHVVHLANSQCTHSSCSTTVISGTFSEL